MTHAAVISPEIPGPTPHLLFDATYYVNEYPDVAEAGLDPLVHFLSIGAAEGKNPHPLFDICFYVREYPDVAKSGLNPLNHFLKFGAEERRNPHPLFDTAFYLHEHPDAAKSGLNPLLHFLRFGSLDQQSPHPLIDMAYLEHQDSIAPLPHPNALVQYILCNGRDGRDPHPLFNTAYYLRLNSDVDSSGQHPLIHYLLAGGFEGRRPHPFFDSEFYLGQCEEARTRRVNPLSHFVTAGRAAGAPHPALDPHYYLSENPDCETRRINPLVHFATGGAWQGRPPCALITHGTMRRLAALHAHDLTGLADSLETEVARRKSLRRHEPSLRNYTEYLEKRIRVRQPRMTAEADSDLLSFMTPVHNPPIEFFAALAESVLGQSDDAFRWFILDNGSTDTGVIALLDSLKNDRQVELHRKESNLGIIGGTRYCLENARGTYVMPLDHDDKLTKDCVCLVRAALHEHGFPDLLYSDEDLVSGDTRYLPYFKPDWDPILFANSCFTAHLAAIKRERALQLDCYSDNSVEGSPDWDTFTRFVGAGATPAHLPEVVYSWRVHPGSTAENIGTKPYVFASQKAVLTRLTAALESNHRFEIDKSPLFDQTPDWWIRGIDLDERPILSVIAGKEGSVRNLKENRARNHELMLLRNFSDFAELRTAARNIAEQGGLVHLCGDLEIEARKWIDETRTLLALFPEIAIVGGRLFQADRIVAGGSIFGFGRGCDCPDVGRARNDLGYFAQMWKQRSVSAVSAQNMVVDAEFLAEALLRLGGQPVSIRYLGAWLGAEARRANRRVVYSPFLCGTATRVWDDLVEDCERAAFVLANRDLMPEARLYSPRLGLTQGTSYQPVTEEERAASLTQLFSWARRTLDQTAATEFGVAAAKLPIYSSPSNRPSAMDVPRFSLMTTIYHATVASLLAETADSVLAQSSPALEWILLAHGPIQRDVASLIDRLSKNDLVSVHSLPSNLGISGGLRWCLERARGDYVMPLDGDDIITGDAIAALTEAAIAEDWPDVLFSDEDMLIDGRRSNPYLRPSWDPVLNLANSYIWHLLALRRGMAMKVGCYTDAGAEYCQDWDTLMRMWQVQARFHHVPRILYHWRQHSASSSNSGGAANEKSADSCRHLLQQVVASVGKSDLFRVTEYPVFRGAPELYLQRRRISPANIDVLLLGFRSARSINNEQRLRNASLFPFARVKTLELDGWAVSVSEFGAALAQVSAPYFAVMNTAILPVGDAWPWDAIGHFELHPDVVAVCGRVVASDGTVVAGGEILGREGRVHSPFFGLDRRAPGDMALALKPLTIDIVNLSMTVLSTAWLRDALTAAPAAMKLFDVPVYLAHAARDAAKRIVYSPLLEARLGIGASPSMILTGQFERLARNVGTTRSPDPGRRGALGYAESAEQAVLAEIGLITSYSTGWVTSRPGT